MSELLYHHCRELDHVHHDLVLPYRHTHALAEPGCRASGDCDHTDAYHDALFMEASYRWLAQRIGFWPLWLAVGTSDDDRRMTGYHNQFHRANINWAAGHAPRNQVLLSWRQPPHEQLRYLCYEHWHLVLNSVRFGEDARPGGGPHATRIAIDDARVPRWVLHESWRPSDWLRMARRQPHSVQAVVPLLDLRSADEVRCRNQRTRRELLRRGFADSQVVVSRLGVDYDSF